MCTWSGYSELSPLAAAVVALRAAGRDESEVRSAFWTSQGSSDLEAARRLRAADEELLGQLARMATFEHFAASN